MISTNFLLLSQWPKSEDCSHYLRYQSTKPLNPHPITTHHLNMTKTSKIKKKSKVKTKKSSKMKSKSKLTPSIPSSQDSTISDNNPSSTSFQRLLKKSLKINHLEVEEKIIRKARRSLNKLKKTGTPDEIHDAEVLLDNAIPQKEEAKQWLDPKLAIEK